MGELHDYAYYVARQRQEQRLAEETTSSEAKLVHLRLATEYESRARELNPEHSIEGAALQADETDPSNRDQTRTAGRESIRDRNPRRSWNEIDEASDESFPASDPPSMP